MALELVWDELDRPQWETLFTAAGPSSLLQSWAWGEAKAQEGWRPRRALLRDGGQAVAIAQILEKRIGGLGRVARLNRGPVWLTPPTDAQVRAALRLIGRDWRWWRLGALFLAPEIAADHGGMLDGLSLRKRNAPAWCSAWLDLAVGSETLRKALDGKWRNMLNGAQKVGLTAEIGSDPQMLEWLLGHYEKLMQNKAFAGTPPALIRQLAKHGRQADDLLVLRARAPDGEAVGGILVARHGAAATYLVGWNGDAGRKLKANNFLLWQAVLALGERNVRWFDLGGIDDVLTPGIAAFKRGMKGQEYRLVGEFLRF